MSRINVNEQFNQMSKQVKKSTINQHIQLPRKIPKAALSYFIKTYGKYVFAFVSSIKRELPIDIVGEIFSFLFIKDDATNYPICSSRLAGQFEMPKQIEKSSCYFPYRFFY